MIKVDLIQKKLESNDSGNEDSDAYEHQISHALAQINNDQANLAHNGGSILINHSHPNNSNQGHDFDQSNRALVQANLNNNNQATTSKNNSSQNIILKKMYVFVNIMDF